MTLRQIDKNGHLIKILSANIIWWLGMLLICIVPFLSSLRVGTLSSFYLESMTLLFVVLLATITVLTQSKQVALPPASWSLLCLAVLLMIQGRLLALPYISQIDLSALVLILMAALAWTARAWVIRIGQIEAVNILSWAILIGTLLQSVVCILQFIGHAGWMPGMLQGPGNHYVYGQLAQRNHLGHYLMWGVLALCFLWHQRQLATWLALLLLVWLTGILGLVGSRTIIAYVLLIALSLPLWRWRAGPAANRLLMIIGLAISLVLLFQFTLSPLCAWLFQIDFQSGTGRLEQGTGFAQSGRYMEWHKAWALFKTAPWFGHGWSSYAYEGFAINHVYPHGFREYETGVLFTYCHNLFLQLLAETGLCGLLITIACFLWSIWSYFRRGFNPASILMVSMMLITLCHSMLEYPLWYGYFLAVFILFVALTPLNYTQKNILFKPNNRVVANVWGVVGLFVIIALFCQMFLYQQFLMVRAEKNVLPATQVEQMQKLKKHMYFLQYYVDMAIIEKLSAAEAPLPEWGQQIALKAGKYRPYSNTFVRGIYLMEIGQTHEAREWFQAMGHYYPNYLPNFLRYAQTRSQTKSVADEIRAMCMEYEQQTKQILNCNHLNKKN